MLPLLLLLLLIGFASAELEVTCPSDSLTSKDGSACYRYYPVKLGYFDALAVCKVHNGTVLDDLAEMSFVIDKHDADRSTNWLRVGSAYDSLCVAYDYKYKSSKTEYCRSTNLPFACRSLPTKDVSQRCPLWTQPASVAYRFYAEPLSWQEARDRCVAVGGDLTTITTSDENAFVNDQTRSFPSWIGANRGQEKEGFRWINGEAVDAHYYEKKFTAWHERSTRLRMARVFRSFCKSGLQ